MEAEVSFGAWVTRRRQALDLTRAQLAKRVGYSLSALRKIESDERRPSQQLGDLLAEHLQIPDEQRSTFLQVARGHLRVERLAAIAPHPAMGIEPDRDLAQPAHRLPTPPTALIGREAEMATLARLLHDPQCRLLTLVGPGGIGKTRLALKVACLQWERFANGVFLASMAATSSSEFMVPTIAQAVGLDFAGLTDPRRQLINYLSHKEVLLLLDNLEHLLDGVDLVVEMFKRAPGLKLLATSRERLELQGEWIFEVQGLPVPAEGEVEGLEKYSSVRLFQQRAQQSQVGFELAVEECPEVARICRLVEGMPLAIELAAAWVPMLTCAEIAEEIEQGLGILTTQLRDVPERQRSMYTVFDHSWRLLAEEERRVLCQLSVFRGGFKREAAQEVTGAGLPLLSTLVAKSFLRRTSTGRFTMHELVRQYIASRLAEEPEQEVEARDRHSVYYTDFAAQLEGELKGAGQVEALAQMDADIHNIRRAWRWAIQRGQAAVAQKPIRALWCFYDIRSLFQEAEASFAWAGDKIDKALRPVDGADGWAGALREYLRAWLGWFYLRRGQLQKADLLLQSSLASLRSFPKSIELADVLYYAGTAAYMKGDYPRARAHWAEELAVAEQYGNQWDIGLATIGIGIVAQTVGEYEEAQQCWQTALAIERSLGDQRMLAAALHFSGILKRTVGAYGVAQAYFRESITLSTLVGERLFYGMSLSQLGLVTQLLGDHAEAVRLLTESVMLLRELGEHWGMLQALNGLGAATLAVGAYAESRAAYCEALTMAHGRQALPEVLEAMTGLSRWWLEQGSPEAGLVPTFFVLNHPSATEPAKEASRQLRAELEAQLTPQQIEMVLASAQAKSFDAVVTELLNTFPRAI